MKGLRVGLVSDTHGLFDPLLGTTLRGVDLILHAGDVCGEEVLDRLSELAPVRAICGNCDGPPLSRTLPPWRLEALAGHRVLVLHDLGKPEAPVPAARKLLARERPDVVVAGHSHQGLAREVGGVLFVNPGSAGRKRFKLERSCAVLTLAKGRAEADVLSLEQAGAPLHHAAWAASPLKPTSR